MKMLSKHAINMIDLHTTNAIDFIRSHTEEGTIEQNTGIEIINNIRKKCDLPKMLFFHKRIFPFPLLDIEPIPKIKMIKPEEHIHDFMILHTNEEVATICCRACGEVRRIETTMPKEKPSNKIIKISIEDFADLCDAAASFGELKELLIDRMEDK